MIRRKLVTRRSRAKLDPSQVPAGSDITATVSTTGTTNITIDFSSPVVVDGQFGIEVATVTVHGQVVVSPTRITLVASGNVAGKAWTIANRDPAVRGSTGGYVVAAAGTF